MLPKRRLTKVKTTKFAAVANQSLRILKVNPRDFSQVFWGDAKSPKNTEIWKKEIRPTRICCSENAHRKLGPTFPVRELRGKKVKKKLSTFTHSARSSLIFVDALRARATRKMLSMLIEHAMTSSFKTFFCSMDFNPNFFKKGPKQKMWQVHIVSHNFHANSSWLSSPFIHPIVFGSFPKTSRFSLRQRCAPHRFQLLIAAHAALQV